MRLCQHADFTAIISEAAASTGLDEPFVEKDYYITEILRTVSGRWGDRVIFKGGTSLSKAWSLIERLSEDVDLLVVRDRFDPPLSRKGVDRELEAMKDDVADHPGLSWAPDRCQGSLKFPTPDH